MTKKILIFDPANPAPSAEWRDYNGLDFLLAPLLPTDLRRIRQEVADLNLDSVAAINEQESRIVDHVIRDWRGPVTPEHTKLPLTKSNKFGVVNAIPNLNVWVRTESDKIAEAQMIKVDGELGNSEASPAGNTGGLAEKTGEQ